jgi:hypothetical protein
LISGLRRDYSVNALAVVHLILSDIPPVRNLISRNGADNDHTTI